MSAASRLAVAALLLLTACAPAPHPDVNPPVSQNDSGQAAAIMRIVAGAVARSHLNAAIVRVTIDGREVLTDAVGDSMTGVPATPDMHFRNGVGRDLVCRDAAAPARRRRHRRARRHAVDSGCPRCRTPTVSRCGQLAQMTSGYVDYVLGNTAMNNALYADPFRALDHR